MIQHSDEGFRILTFPGGERHLQIDSERLEKCLGFLVSSNIKHLYIGSLWGYKLYDLEFLKGIAGYVEGVTVDSSVDQNAVNLLHNLRYLNIYNEKQPIDLSNFPKLETCTANFGKNLIGLESCKNLNELTLVGYRPKSKDFAEFPELKKLAKLKVLGGSLLNLSGIGNLPLSEFSVFSLAKLTSISALTSLSKSLRKLQIESCRRVTDFDSLRSMRALEKLMISQCGSIPSIDFIKEISSLVFFSFSGTNILDGDLSPLEGLKYAGFDDKRHYSRKWKDFHWENITWDD